MLLRHGAHAITYCHANRWPNSRADVTHGYTYSSAYASADDTSTNAGVFQ